MINCKNSSFCNGNPDDKYRFPENDYLLQLASTLCNSLKSKIKVSGVTSNHWIMFMHIFISYARPDKLMAEQVEKFLINQGYQVFRDESSILTGDEWRNVIHRELNKADVMVLLMSTHSMPIRTEVYREWSYFIDHLHRPLIPFLVEPCSPHAAIAGYNYIDVGNNLQAALQMLNAQLKKRHNRDLSMDTNIGLTDNAQVLDWGDIKSVFEKVSLLHLKNTFEKYDTNLYVSRFSVDRAFDDFLDSRFICCVVLGKSGVGKSNFIISAVHENFRQESNTATIVLDSNVVENQDIFDLIGNEMSKALNYSHVLTGEELFHQLSKMNDMERHQVIIAVDGINESPHAVAILKSIDKWVEIAGTSQSKWLKVVVTSRPQAWRNIQATSGHLNSAYYYKSTTQQTTSFEADAFLTIEEFLAKYEFEEVYKKYQIKYGVLTQLHLLPAQVANLLRDPLTLKLVMKTYGNEIYGYRIPEIITTQEVIEQYITAVRNNRGFDQGAFALLEKRILPAMFAEGPFFNQLKITEYSETADIAELFNAIFNTTEYSKINKALMDLINAEIITLQQTGTSDIIRFKYERFYDFFAANHLRNQLRDKSSDERKQVYVTLVERFNVTPYLWGPLQIQLVEECFEKQFLLIKDLALTNNPRVRDLVLSVLQDYGRRTQLRKTKANSISDVEHLCLDLLNIKSKRATTNAQSAAVLAVQLAEALYFKNVLVEAACSSIDILVDASTEALINIWTDKENRPGSLEFAFDVTRQIVDQLTLVRPRVFVSGLKSLVILALAVYFLEYKNKADWTRISKELAEITVAAFRKIPVIRFLVPRINSAGVSKGFRLYLLRSSVSFLLNVAARVGENHRIIFDMSAAESFFKLTIEERNRYRVFVDHIVTDNPLNTLQVLQPLLESTMDDRQLIGSYIISAPILAAMPYNETQVNAQITDLFEKAKHLFPNTASMSNVGGTAALSIHLILLRNTMVRPSGLNVQNLDNFGNVLEQVESQFWSLFQTTTTALSWMDIPTYYYFARRLGVQHNYELLRSTIKLRLSRQQFMTYDEFKWYMGRFIHDLAAVGYHILFKSPELAIEMLTVFFAETPTPVITLVKDNLIEELLRLRTIDELAIESFVGSLPKEKFDDISKSLVRTGTLRYDLGIRIGTAGSWFFRDIMFDEDPYMRKLTQWFFYTSLEAKDPYQWLSKIVDVILITLFTGSISPEQLLAEYKS